MDLVFATHNAHKLSEIKPLLNSGWCIKSLEEAGFNEEVPETGDTLEANALQKARFVHNQLGVNCFADDTGLEVEALNGAPGVLSARYAGPEKNSRENVQLVLEQLHGCDNRRARFRTVLALILSGEEHLFEGIVEGTILSAPAGEGGFGYDPVFRPLEATVSFAQMPLAQKNKMSHRAKAFQKLADFLDRVLLKKNGEY